MSGGANPNEIATAAREQSYSQWRDQPSRRENAGIANDYSAAMSKFQSARSAKESESSTASIAAALTTAMGNEKAKSEGGAASSAAEPDAGPAKDKAGG